MCSHYSFLDHFDMKITVLTHPNSKLPRVEKDLAGQLHVYVAAAPLEGKANVAVITALADYFNCRKSAICMVSGQKSKHKVFEILI